MLISISMKYRQGYIFFARLNKVRFDVSVCTCHHQSVQQQGIYKVVSI